MFAHLILRTFAPFKWTIANILDVCGSLNLCLIKCLLWEHPLICTNTARLHYIFHIVVTFKTVPPSDFWTSTIFLFYDFFFLSPKRGALISQLWCHICVAMTPGFFCSQVIFPLVYINLVGLGEEVPENPTGQTYCVWPTRRHSFWLWSSASSGGPGDMALVRLLPSSRWKNQTGAQDLSISCALCPRKWGKGCLQWNLFSKQANKKCLWYEHSNYAVPVS